MLRQYSAAAFGLTQVTDVTPLSNQEAYRLTPNWYLLLAKSKDASLRVAAALALWQVAGDRPAIAVISEMLASEDVNAAHEAARAMAHLGSAARPVIGSLVRALESGTEDVRLTGRRLQRWFLACCVRLRDAWKNSQQACLR